MGARHRAREIAVQLLFQIDLSGDRPDAVLPMYWAGKRFPREVREFAEALVRGAWEDREEIDRRIRECSENWRVERMAAVDRNVLRLAVFELLHPGETPAAVILDEAIEIAKRFGNADSGPFVNGVLDAVRKRLSSGSVAGGSPS